jgi:hypothetical protein
MAMANGERRMKLIRVSLLAIVICAGVQADAQQAPPVKPDASFLVANGKAGVFEIGMTVDEAQAIAGVSRTKLVAVYPEGMFQEELEISIAGFSAGPAIVAPISNFPCSLPALRGLEVRDPRFKTAHGIHVGSTLADIRKYQPAAKIGNFGADGFPGVFDAEPGVTFAFRGAEQSRDSERVTALWVHGEPNVRARRCPDFDEWPDVFQAAFDAVVMPEYKKLGEDRPPLIVMAETNAMCDAGFTPLNGVGCLDRARTTAPFLGGKLAEAFYGRNSGRGEVPMLAGASAVVAAADLKRIVPRFGQLDSRHFIVTFSSPGFDNGRAAVYVSYGCGSTCGEGMLVLLELRDEKWKVASVQPLWVS